MTKEEFISIMLRQKASRLPVIAFCRNEGYGKTWFYTWKQRFGITEEDLATASTNRTGMDVFAPITISNMLPESQPKQITIPDKGEKRESQSIDSSEISLELPNGIKMKFKGPSGCKAALNLITKLCGSCFV